MCEFSGCLGMGNAVNSRLCRRVKICCWLGTGIYESYLYGMVLLGPWFKILLLMG